MHRKRYARANKGLIHLVSAIRVEYTVCGDAFDGDAKGKGIDAYAWEECKPTPITCQQCIAEILNCRGAVVAIGKRKATIS